MRTISTLLERVKFYAHGIIISLLLIMAFFKSLTKKYIFQLTNCEHKGVSESIDSEDRSFPVRDLNSFFF